MTDQISGRCSVRRALLSVSDKTGILDLARGLADGHVEILSTGGTAALLSTEGIPVTAVSDFTGFPEILDGRVKTLHPRLFGGILAKRNEPAHLAQMEANALLPIDLVVVNLYPFAATVAREGVTLPEAIEQIDIGGPSLLRAAAKNHADVAVLVDPADYESLLAELRDGGSTADSRFRWARKVFAHTASYDRTIASTLEERWGDRPGAAHPEVLRLEFRRIQELRYGENPHQSGAFYREEPAVASFAAYRQLQGKELSYNNLLDAAAARDLVASLPAPSVVIVKHNNPCGAATAARAADALRNAWSGDPVSAFGGIVAFNGEVDAESAHWLVPNFVEVVLAPSFSEEARRAFATKKNVRLLEIPAGRSASPELRAVDGGLLVQKRDPVDDDPATWQVVSHRAPTDEERHDLAFAWPVSAAVKSNAIVLVRGGRVLGVGAGQMSRVDSCRLAVEKARSAGSGPEGAVAASDAFFPFPDGLRLLAEAGITAIAHPGGSMRDGEVIAAADELKLALVVTGKRHFRH